MDSDTKPVLLLTSPPTQTLLAAGLLYRYIVPCYFSFSRPELFFLKVRQSGPRDSSKITQQNMVSNAFFFAAVSVALASQTSAHIGRSTFFTSPWSSCVNFRVSLALWHPSMFGFNQSNFPTNRPQDPLADMTFDKWWFHGHLKYPPHLNDIMKLPVGGDAVVELACDKGATSWYASGPGGDARDLQNPDYPCPHAPLAAFHTNGLNDLGGCALSVAYKSDANDVKPEDLVIFSVQHKCVWNLHTHFKIPSDMPPCPNGKCTCAWHWIHKPDSGSEQSGFPSI